MEGVRMIGDLTVLMDPYFLIRLGHIAGAVIAIGAVLSTDTLNGIMHFRPNFAGTMAKVAPVLSMLVWIGFFLTSFTGLFLFLQNPFVVQDPTFQLKMIFVTVVFLNGVFLNVWITPRFQGLADEWPDQTDRTQRFEKVAGLTAVISFIGWWAVLVLGYIVAHT